MASPTYTQPYRPPYGRIERRLRSQYRYTAAQARLDAWMQETDDELQDAIDVMNAHEWAEGTLTGIRTTVERTGTVTEGQRRAIDNIEGAGMRGGRRW